MTPTEPQNPRGPSASRRRPLPWLLAIAGVAVIALAVALLVPGGSLNAGPGDPSPSISESDPDSPAGTPTAPSPTDDPSPGPASPTEDESPSDYPGTASPSAPTDPTTPSVPGPGATSHPAISAAPGELTEDDATALLENALVPLVEQAESVQDLDDLMADAVTDAYAEELEAQWLELSSQGWSVSGAPTVSSLEITSLESTSQPATAEVLACIDSSDVTIVDAEGTPVGDPDAVMTRAQHRFTMIQAEDGIWRISSRAFPDAPDC